jgi:hypothetical protein
MSNILSKIHDEEDELERETMLARAMRQNEVKEPKRETIEEMLHKTYRRLELLELILDLEKRRSLYVEHIEGLAGTFPDLKKKFLNKIDTIQRGIDRLKKRL